MQQIDKEYWVSCVFPNDDEHLPDGTDINELVWAMLEGPRPPFAIGINCTKIRRIANLIKSFEQAATGRSLQLPRLVVYPDGAGGKVYDTKLQQWIGDDSLETPWDEQMLEIIKKVRSSNLWKGIIVGGCCKTTPDHIRKLRGRLDDL
jgi:homocysteine S-methyltransferase